MHEWHEWLCCLPIEFFSLLPNIIAALQQCSVHVTKVVRALSLFRDTFTFSYENQDRAQSNKQSALFQVNRKSLFSLNSFISAWFGENSRQSVFQNSKNKISRSWWLHSWKAPPIHFKLLNINNNSRLILGYCYK